MMASLREKWPHKGGAAPAAAAALHNPAQRHDIRPDFPKTLDLYSAEKALKVLEAELQKQGSSLDRVGHITLVYPHKHPKLFPGHDNQAAHSVSEFHSRLCKAAPQVKWIIADGIVETVHLDRSGNQTSVHALMSQQVYEFYQPAQKDPLPFAENKPGGAEFFLAVDSCIEQGTTIANLMSYVEHNGGRVLAAVSGSMSGRPIAQKPFPTGRKPSLSAAFNDAARNTGRLPQLAEVLHHSARGEGLKLSARECLDRFEAALQKNGNSVFALTDGECERLVDSLSGSYYKTETFSSLLAQLEKRAAPQKTPPMDPVSRLRAMFD